MHLFLTCLHFLCTLSNSSLKHVHSFLRALQVYFLRRFYLAYGIFRFSSEEDEQILRLGVIMKNMLDKWQLLPV